LHTSDGARLLATPQIATARPGNGGEQFLLLLRRHVECFVRFVTLPGLLVGAVAAAVKQPGELPT